MNDPTPPCDRCDVTNRSVFGPFWYIDAPASLCGHHVLCDACHSLIRSILSGLAERMRKLPEARLVELAIEVGE